MKKTLSIIMALCMVLSVCFFSVSAAEATVGSVATDYTPADGAIAITDAAGFAAMAADGNYYLANDITLSATWNAKVAVSATYKENTAFTGTFDGNGKTITTSAPLFANLQGTVKNLVIEGDIDAGGLYCGSVSMWTEGDITVENVYNKVNISHGGRTGGILGYGETGTVATFINCQNDGDIQATDIIGGIAGYVRDDSVTIKDCVNYGNFETTNYAAGIIGRFGRDDARAPDSFVTITGCVNYGKIVSAKSQTAGILGFLVGKAVIKNCVNYGEIVNNNGFSGGIFGMSRKPDYACSITIDKCENYGEIVATTGAGGIAGKMGVKLPIQSEKYYISNCTNFGDVSVKALENSTDIYVGGLVGYAYGDSEGEPNGIINCVNTGDVIVDCSTSTGKTYVAGILGYVNNASYEMKNNINAGNITVTGEPTTVALTVYNKSLKNKSISNNYSIAIDGIDTALAGDPAAEAPAFATAVTADKLASGEVAYLINEAAGEIIYYQTIGTDKVPTLVAAASSSNVVEKGEDGAFVNPPPVLTVNGEYTYNGSPIKPDVTLTLAGNELKEGVDYTITCENNVNAGTATVTATLIGNYSGSISKTFTIAPREVILVWENTDMMYNGERQTPTAKLFGVVAGDVCDVTVSGWGKFGGTYTAKVESLSNPNYYITGDTTCRFNIIANPFEAAVDVAVDIYDIIPGSAKQAVADAAINAANNAASDLANAADEAASDLAGIAIEAAEAKAAEIKETVETAYEKIRDFLTDIFGSYTFFGW